LLVENLFLGPSTSEVNSMENSFESDEDEISVISFIKEDYPKHTGYLQVVPCTQIVIFGDNFKSHAHF
jgi:hypothetical protein